MNSKKWMGISIIILAILALGYTVIIQRKSISASKTLRVGVLIPLTGKFANYGEDIKNALELGKRSLQNTQGISIELVYEDSAADPKTAVPAAVKLIEVEKAAFVIGGPGSSANLAAAPLFEKHHIPFLPVSNAPRLENAGIYIFKMLSSIYPELDIALPELQSERIQRISIIYDSASDTLTLGKDYLTKILVQAGGTVAISEGYDSKSTIDFRSTLTKIKGSSSDAVYLFSADKDGGSIIRQARELGLSIPFYGWGAQNTAEFFNAAGNFSEGMTITDVPFSCEDTKAERTIRYCSEYKNTYNNRIPLMFGARAYDTLVLSAERYAQGTPDDKVRQFIENMTRIRNYQGISGTVDIDKNGNAEDKVFVIRVAKNGAFVQK
ncbi:MAG: ABC transporter substrate-binding protein [Patescibacteria group bacterium]